MKYYERAEAWIHLDAARFNMEQMHRGLQEGTRMLAVVKADGYGHGAIEIAREIEDLPYLYGFSVATLEEAVSLRKQGITKPINLLGYVFPSQYEDAVTHEIALALFDFESARALSKTATKLQKKGFYHVALDTGMNRIGYDVTKEAAIEIAQMTALPNIELLGMFTHFYLSDGADKAPADAQLKEYNKMIELLKEQGVTIPLQHCSNSAALIDMPYANLDLVRAGISLYGLRPSADVKEITLQPMMELKARVTYVKDLYPNEMVSYGGTYQATEKRRIATIGFGYADGYPRSLSNKGWVLLHGQKAPIRGRVCMDQFMVDVTDIPDVKTGDVATLIGKDGNERITMEMMGDLSGRFNYEFACCISKRVPRVYLKNDKLQSRRDAF